MLVKTLQRNVKESRKKSLLNAEVKRVWGKIKGVLVVASECGSEQVTCNVYEYVADKHKGNTDLIIHEIILAARKEGIKTEYIPNQHAKFSWR
jgi:hypothetical protein